MFDDRPALHRAIIHGSTGWSDSTDGSRVGNIRKGCRFRKVGSLIMFQPENFQHFAERNRSMVTLSDYSPIVAVEREQSSCSIATIADEPLVEIVIEGCSKFRRIIPYIIELRRRFQDRPRGSANIAGCNTWTEFCEKKLDRTVRAVQKAIAVESNPPDVENAAKIEEPEAEFEAREIGPKKLQFSSRHREPSNVLIKMLRPLLPLEGDGVEHKLHTALEEAAEHFNGSDEAKTQVVWMLREISKTFSLYAKRIDGR
jgi:hypothetical protein